MIEPMTDVERDKLNLEAEKTGDMVDVDVLIALDKRCSLFDDAYHHLTFCRYCSEMRLGACDEPSILRLRDAISKLSG